MSNIEAAYAKVQADYAALGADITALGAFIAPANVFQAAYPFPASVFAKPLPAALAPIPASATMIANFLATFPAQYNGVGVNRGPIVRVQPGQPAVPLTVNAGQNDFTANTGKTIQLPPGVAIPDSGDGPEVCEVLGVEVTELWQAKATAAGYSASWGGKLASLASSTAVFPYNYGMAASGLSYRATMITQNDLLAGKPSHVISFQVGDIDSQIAAPANRTDGSSRPGYLYYGLGVAFPKSVAMPAGMSPFAQFVFQSLQTFGGVVMDQTRQSGQYTVAEDGSEWTRQGMTGTDPVTAAMAGQPGYSVLSLIPWSKLEVVTL